MAPQWAAPDMLAACCGSTVKLWSTAQAADKPGVLALEERGKLAEGAAVRALDWSSNNKVLAVAGDKGQIGMWSQGQCMGGLPEAGSEAVDALTAIRFASDSKRVALGCRNGALHVMDMRKVCCLGWLGWVGCCCC